MGGHSRNPFKVEFWDARGNILPEMAVCENALVARAAFDESARLYPFERITLRHGAHMLEEHKPIPRPSWKALPPQR